MNTSGVRMLGIIDNYLDFYKCFSNPTWQEYGFGGCSFHMNFNKATASTTIKEAFTDYTEKKKHCNADTCQRCCS